MLSDIRYQGPTTFLWPDDPEAKYYPPDFNPLTFENGNTFLPESDIIFNQSEVIKVCVLGQAWVGYCFLFNFSMCINIFFSFFFLLAAKKRSVLCWVFFI